MTWRRDDQQGRESAKVRMDLVPYMAGRVLDLGCGEEKIFPTAIGLDNSIDAKLFGIHIKPDIPVDTCERMEFLADGAADTVFSSHLLEHIADYRGALKEWWRLTKVGGHLILYLPNNEDDVEHGGYPKMGEPGANPDHKWDVTFDRVVEAMRAVGGWDLVQYEKRDQDREYSLLFVFKKTEAAGLAAGCDPVGQEIEAAKATIRNAVGVGAEHRFSYREPKPVQKTLGIVRLGAFGDALWISALLPYYKAEGWHITVYTQAQGEQALRHDPHIDRIICQPKGIFEFGDGKASAWQMAYWLHEEKKYDRFVNLIGSTERRLLPQAFDPDFYLPFEQRHRMMNRNYLEALHEWAGIPFDRDTVRTRFYPSADELAWAAEYRASLDGPLVLVNPSGSSLPKWWPYAQELCDRLGAEKIHSLITGDLRLNKFRLGPYGKAVGTEIPIRKIFALAALADVVVGTESALVNAVAYEQPLKVVIMSHSTHENLTRDWTNTIAIEPEGLDCYPCHRVHMDMIHCTHDKDANAAACQSAAKAKLVFDHIMAYLAERNREAA